jgi:hypothetical protein
MDFFESILPPDGLYCIASAKLEDGKSRLSKLVHIPIKGMDELRKLLPSIIQSNSNRELYFSPSSYVEEKPANNGFRKNTNVKYIKSLYLDVDIRPDSPVYCHSYEEALSELEKLRQKVGLPNPWIVDSGLGLHIYWPLDTHLSPATWTKVATEFFNTVSKIAPKLVADGSRPRDKSALLRLPGSLNHKHGQVKLVSILQDADGEVDHRIFLSEDSESLVTSTPVPTKEYSVIKAEDRVHINHVVKACNWIREYIDNKETASEPEWYAALSVARFVFITDPNSDTEAAIAFSKGHPGYTLAGTLKKIDQLVQNGIGPATCDTLGGMFPDRCRTCPLRGFVGSPVAAGRKIANTDEEDVQLILSSSPTEKPRIEDLGEVEPPKPYFIKDGQIFMHKADAIVRIFDFLIVPHRRCKDEYTGQEMVEFLVKFPHDGDRIIKMPMSLLADDKRLGVFLADYGILPERSFAPYLFKYLTNYVRELQARKPAVKNYSQLGWRFPDINNENVAEFILGDMVYHDRQWTPNTSISPVLLPVKSAASSSSGNLEKWIRAFSCLNEIPNSEPLIAAALMGFAAPLIEFTPYNGILVNLYGGSGRGKSTAQRFATSIWGTPNERMILTHDNRIPMLNRIGAMRNLPVTFDELTEMDPEALGTLLYEISGGRGKERANISGITKTNETTWKTVIISSSNTSIYTKIARIRAGNNGQAYRVLEFEVSPALACNALVIDEAKNVLDANYGIAGKVYVQYLVDNLVSVRRRMNEAMKEITAQYQSAPAERFWLASLAAMKVGGEIAKSIGLHTYDVKSIFEWAVAAMKSIRTTIKDNFGDPLNVLNQFLLENLGTTIRDDGSSNMIMVPPNARSIAVRYQGIGKQINEVYVTKKALIDYCNFYKIEYGWLVSALKDRKLLKGIKKANLLEKTGLPPVEVDCFIFDTEALSNADCITEAKKLTPILSTNKLHLN